MLDTALGSIGDADCIMWLVEPSDFIGKGEQYILEELKKSPLPVILVMNKIDSVEKDDLLRFIDAYRKVFDFAEIVPISAREGTNVDVLVEQLFKYLPEGPLYYDEDTLTDQQMKQIVAEIIREKALHCLNEEVPHGIAVVIDRYHERVKRTKMGDGVSFEQPIVDIEATIICEKDSHKGIVIGKGGAMLKKIGSIARKDIEQLTETKVNLKLWVKVRKEWRDNDAWLKSLGYQKEK
jgi:GTP-binding protein Era